MALISLPPAPSCLSSASDRPSQPHAESAVLSLYMSRACLILRTCNEPAKGVWQRDGAARVIFFPCLSLLPNEPGSVLKGALAAAYHHAPPRRNRAEPPQTSSSLTPARRRQAMLDDKRGEPDTQVPLCLPASATDFLAPPPGCCLLLHI